MFPTYVFAKVQRDRVPQVAKELRKYSEIEFSAQVTGRYVIIMRIKSSNPEQLTNVINKIRTIHGVNATNTITANDGFVNGQNLTRKAFGDSAYYQLTSHYPKYYRN